MRSLPWEEEEAELEEEASEPEPVALQGSMLTQGGPEHPAPWASSKCQQTEAQSCKGQQEASSSDSKETAVNGTLLSECCDKKESEVKSLFRNEECCDRLVMSARVIGIGVSTGPVSAILDVVQFPVQMRKLRPREGEELPKVLVVNKRERGPEPRLHY